MINQTPSAAADSTPEDDGDFIPGVVTQKPSTLGNAEPESANIIAGRQGESEQSSAPQNLPPTYDDFRRMRFEQAIAAIQEREERETAALEKLEAAAAQAEQFQLAADIDVTADAEPIRETLDNGRDVVARGLEKLARQIVEEGQPVDVVQYKALLAIAAAQKFIAQSACPRGPGHPMNGYTVQRLQRSAFGAGHGGKREGAGRKPAKPSIIHDKPYVANMEYAIRAEYNKLWDDYNAAKNVPPQSACDSI